MFVFTSCTNNYIPKARVLVSSLKTFHPDWTFCLLLGETPPQGFNLEEEAFDRVVTFDQLGIPDYRAWLFRHRVVEICTAAKGPALYHFLETEGHGKVLYLDPDTMVCNSLAPLETLLDTHDILLTPHMLAPQPTPQAVEDNELTALRFGVFNLGFAAAARRGQGPKFARWWRDRLLEYCYDDIPRGLFTDQRWCDLAPTFFSQLHILRDPGYNAASWNLTDRTITRAADGTFMANDVPLRFYHFTGFDSGAGESMTARYAADMPAVTELWALYRERLMISGQQELGTARWAGMFFDDGTPITDAMRLLYRHRPDVQAAFPNPFVTPGYRDWYMADQYPSGPAGKVIRKLSTLLHIVRTQLAGHGGFPHAVPRLARKTVTKIRQQGIRSVLRMLRPETLLQVTSPRPETPAPVTLPRLEDMLQTDAGRKKFSRAFDPEAETVLVVEHDWGGGAAQYAEERVSDLRDQGCNVVRLRYALNAGRLELTVLGPQGDLRYALEDIRTLTHIAFPRLSSLLVNNLAGWYSSPEAALDDPAVMHRTAQALSALSHVAQVHQAHVEYMFHDFFAVCPSFNLLQQGETYCDLPDAETECASCPHGKALPEWRSAWHTFLRQVDQVVFFSENTRRLVTRVYDLPAERLVVQPHSIPEYFSSPLHIPAEGPMRIAVVGHISPHKGAVVLEELAMLLQSRSPDARIIVFGQATFAACPDNVRILGEFRREDLPRLLEQEGVTVAAFTSICPETFSYVLHELAALHIPIASFNLGAQGDFVASLPNGRVAEDMTAEALLDALQDLDKRRRLQE